MLTTARPRTLVLAVWDDRIDVAMIGPRGSELGTRQVVPIAAGLETVWTAIERLGEFDRITLVGADPRDLGHNLARLSHRPLRRMSHGALRWGHVIAGDGVELALALGTRFVSTVYYGGVELAGLDLAQQRVRKNRRLREYLAPQVYERKGADVWRRRVTRTIDELLAVWNPTTLFLSAPPTLPMPELPPQVVVVPARNSLAEGLRVWTAESDQPAARI
jgi:hypothetical protein